MKRYRNSIQKLATLALCVALAMILSYVELLLPPITPSVPGAKMGLANIMTIFLLYRFRARDAIGVSLTRIALSAVLFGNTLSLVYSLAGGACSLLVMAILKKMRLFSSLGVSVSGAVAHNLGQILAAMILLSTPQIGYYAAILVFTGTISGVLVGLCAAFLIKRIPPIGGETT